MSEKVGFSPEILYMIMYPQWIPILLCLTDWKLLYNKPGRLECNKIIPIKQNMSHVINNLFITCTSRNGNSRKGTGRILHTDQTHFYFGKNVPESILLSVPWKYQIFKWKYSNSLLNQESKNIGSKQNTVHRTLPFDKSIYTVGLQEQAFCVLSVSHNFSPTCLHQTICTLLLF